MIARILERRDDGRAAVAVAAASAAGLLVVLLSDVVHHPHVIIPRAPGPAAYAAVAAAMLACGLAPWLVRRSGGVTCRVSVTPGIVRAASGLVLRADDVTAVRVARGARGASVAVARKKGVVFLEVDREEDARAIAGALGDASGRRAVPVVPARRALAFVQSLLFVLVAGAASAYLYGALGGDSALKSAYGPTALGFAVLSLFWLVFLRTSRTPVLVRRTRWDAHVALHAADAADAADASRGADAAEAPLETAPDLPMLAQGGEPPAAWLAKLDALPRDAYRGDALGRDALFDTLRDAGAAPDARIAAARLLTKRHAEPAESLVRVVADPEVRVRVAAVADEEDPGDAAERLEALGPLFRARAGR